MEVTRCNLKTIVKGSGGYHKKRWNVKKAAGALGIDRSSLYNKRYEALITSATPCTQSRARRPLPV